MNSLGTRPRLPFSPTRPLHDAGMRIDPPPSLACASGAIPDATAAPAPPLEPPGVCWVFHGLRVMPCASLSVYEIVPNSGEFVIPSSTKPAARNRSTIGSDSARGGRVAPFDP